jgi:hypothetical protein
VVCHPFQDKLLRSQVQSHGSPFCPGRSGSE